MKVADRMHAKLEAALAPQQLELLDESHLHAGHTGARPEGESHFALSLVSSAFEGLGRMQRHQRVHAILAEELKGPVHALRMTLKAPSEL